MLALPALRTYSRTEFTALHVCERLVDRDDHAARDGTLDVDADCTAEPLDVDRLLRAMRDDLVGVDARCNRCGRNWWHSALASAPAGRAYWSLG